MNRHFRTTLRNALAATWLAASPAMANNGPLADASREFDAGNYTQAATILSAALERDPGQAELHYWLSRCYFELHEIDRAVANGERAITLEPRKSDYHYWLGKYYGRKAEQAGPFSGFSLARKTRREFQEAVRLAPSNFPAQLDLIEFYLRAPGIVGGGSDKAKQQVDSLAAIDRVEYHVALGTYWLDKKKLEQAETEFAEAFELRPQRADLYFEIAGFYQRVNKPERMEEAVEAAARIDPSDRQLSYFRGVVRVLAGDRLSEAEELLKTYLDKIPPRSDLPSPAWAHFWLGRLYERQSKCQVAAQEYRAALTIDPHNKSAHDALRHVCK